MKIIYIYRKSASHGDNDNDDMKYNDMNMNNNNNNSNKNINNINSLCVSRVQLEDTTISWILSVFQVNLQKAAQQSQSNPVCIVVFY